MKEIKIIIRSFDRTLINELDNSFINFVHYLENELSNYLFNSIFIPMIEL
jgi:hypothetical protein